MKRMPAVSACLAIVTLACAIAPAHATSNYAYQKNEYPIINDGLAPNKLFSIAADGGGELGYDNFHLYLMAEPAHTMIGPLEQIGEGALLDTGSDAYHAEWSEDSRHVAVL